MRIAIPVWDAGISPVFDFCRHILIVDSAQSRELFRCVYPLPKMSMASRTERLRELDVDLLLCGGISNTMQKMVSSAGISLIPWKCGPVDEVLRAYFSSSLDDPRYNMPGTRGGGTLSTGTGP
jgi:predicted Fe-Mo cluster-binding NifX family protein